ncbi:MAG: amino acid adenylation domain-containing protein [Chloroflexota bacterium]
MDLINENNEANVQDRLSNLSPEKRAWVLQQLRKKQATQNNGSVDDAIGHIDRTQVIPLSFAQQRLWFLNQLEGPSSTYTIFIGWQLVGTLNLDALVDSIAEIVRRHESLRTTFPAHQGKPVQRIHPPEFIQLTQVSLQSLDETEKALTVQRLANEAAQHCYDLENGPLFHAKLLNTAHDEHYLFLTMHHAISDGWSMDVLVREMVALYNAFSLGNPSPLPSLPIQYADYAQWQRKQMQTTLSQEQLSYWQSRLVDAPPLLELPTDHPRPAIQRFRGTAHPFLFSRELSNALHRLAQQSETTLFMVLQATLAVLLYRYSGQEDILIGLPIANRDQPEIEPLIGFFANQLVLRSNLAGNPTFDELLQQVRQNALEAYQHNALPFEHLVEALQPTRALSYSPLFQVAFSWQNTDSDTPTLLGLDATRIFVERTSAIFDLTLYMHEMAQDIYGEWEYNTDLFTESTIQHMTDHFQTLLTEIVANPNEHIQTLPLLTEIERDKQLTQWNQTSVSTTISGSTQPCIHQLFEAQVERTPYDIAVVFEQEKLTYRRLNQRVNQLANYLIQHGVGPETLVGICMERSSEMLVGILGVLKAGGAYMPIDPNYPDARIAFMLEDAQPQLVLTSQQMKSKLPADVASLALDSEWSLLENQSTENPTARAEPNNLAYCIYTSGSTGTPKGTLIEHRNLTNYLQWAVQAYEVEAGCGAPVNTSIGFDATITSLFTPLLVGKTVFLLPEETELEALAHLLQSGEPLSVVKLTPTHLDILSRMVERPTQTRYFIIGGEALFEHHLTFWRSYAPNTHFINEYGPTETVVGCCVYDAKDAVSSGAVPISGSDTSGSDTSGSDTSGSSVGAIANTQLYILDAHREPVPFGVHGELYIGGAGVGRGYLNQAALTAERFIDNPFGAGKLYKTGDKVRRLADGKIEFLGRIDTQVKLRGFRIELGEIESTLASHPQIQEAVVNLAEINTAATHPGKIRHCVRCGLPSNHPDAKLNAKDVCTSCVTYETYRTTSETYFKHMDEFHRLVDEMKRTRRGQYDCMMLLSGGKDSTYVLGQLVEMGLKVLSFTLDNGYISEETKVNIRRVVDALGVDHVFGTTPAMNAVFVESLQQHSNVCQGCFKVIYTLSTNLAHQHGIQYIVTGLSRGQIFETRLQPMFQNGIFDVEEIDRRILESRKVYHRLNDVVSQQMDVAIFQEDAIFDEVQFVDFYRYSDVELADMYEFLDHRLPWVRPTDTGRSTNCLINEVGIYIHKRERGYHNYALPYSWDVILGHKERQAAMDELDDDIDEASVQAILQEIGYDQRSIVDQQLVAYYVAEVGFEHTELEHNDLHRHLAQTLPAYMVPSAFVRLDKMPLTANGKLNRKALPVPMQRVTGKATSGTTYVMPQTEAERQIASVWQDVLKVERVGVHHNFFDLGGHSLLLVQVHSRLCDLFGQKIAITALFRYPTVQALAKHLAGDPRTTGVAKQVEINVKTSATRRQLRETRNLRGNQRRTRKQKSRV